MPEDWSRDGRVAYAQQTRGTGLDLWMSAPSNAKPEPFSTKPLIQEWSAQFSPDGASVAFVSDESGQPRSTSRPRGRLTPDDRSRMAAAPRPGGGRTARSCSTRRWISGRSWRSQIERGAGPSLRRSGAAGPARTHTGRARPRAEHGLRRRFERATVPGELAGGRTRHVPNHTRAELARAAEALTRFTGGAAPRRGGAATHRHPEMKYDGARADFVAVLQTHGL